MDRRLALFGPRAEYGERQEPPTVNERLPVLTARTAAPDAPFGDDSGPKRMPAGVRVALVGVDGLDVQLPPVAELAVQGDALVLERVEAYEGLLG